MSYTANPFGLLAGFAVFGVMLAVAPAVGECTSAGIVTRVNGDDGMYFERVGAPKPIPVRVTTLVCVRDILRAGGANGTVTILLADGSQPDYKADSVIKPIKHSVPTWFGKFMDEFTSKVGPYVYTVGRDGKDDVPFEFLIHPLADETAKIAGGHDGLYLRWSGGVAPYNVQLKRADGKIEGSEPNAVGGAVYLNLHKPLVAGRWVVTVRDFYDREIKGGFEVDFAKAYKPIDASGPFAEIQAATEAVSVAKADAVWALEADQLFAMAPAQKLDRAPVLKAISCLSYGANEPASCK